MNFFRTNEVILKLLQMDTGDVFSTAKLRKGFDDHRQILRDFRLHRLHRRRRISEPIPNEDKIDLTLEFDEGQRLLRPPHRFFGQHHHARQGDPPPAAAGRRRRLQQAPLGAQHSAFEPARLFRGVESGVGRGYQQGQQERHGGHHAQSERARQEFDSVAGRRLGAWRAVSWDCPTPPTTSWD